MKNFIKFKHKDKIFLLIVVLTYFLYLLSFVHQSFNATDEGLIIQMGNRITQGEIPYKDFHYNRTPLPIYKQAFYITLIGNYSILSSRIIWGFEVFLCILISFFIVKRVPEIRKYYLFLFSSIFFVIFLFNFPWYTYDGVLFGLISIYFFLISDFKNKKYILISGFFSFLSFMSKQNFLVITISIIILALINYVINRHYKINFEPKISIIPYYLSGFLFGLAPYLFYLIYTNTLQQFFYHIFILPGECIDLGLKFLFFMNTVPILYIPVITIFFSAFVINFNNKVFNFIKYFFVISFLPIIYLITNKFTIFLTIITILNFLILSIQFIIGYFDKIKGGKKNLSNHLIVVTFFALFLQYAAGLTYAGIIYCYIGFFLSLPLTLIILFNNLFYSKINFKFFELFVSKKLVIIFTISIIILALVIHQNLVYRDYPRSQLNYQFSSEKMKGIFSNENNVKRIDRIVDYIQNNTNKSDYIFIFPDYSIIYYLTDRKNPTKIDRYSDEELTERLAIETVQDLERNQPKLILLQSYMESDYMRIGKPFNYFSSSEHKIIYEYIIKNFNKISQIDDVDIFKSN